MGLLLFVEVSSEVFACAGVEYYGGILWSLGAKGITTIMEGPIVLEVRIGSYIWVLTTKYWQYGLGGKICPIV